MDKTKLFVYDYIEMTNIINTQGLRYINLDLLECANCFQISNGGFSKKVGNGEYFKKNPQSSNCSGTFFTVSYIKPALVQMAKKSWTSFMHDP